jgi:hypothetical protein
MSENVLCRQQIQRTEVYGEGGSMVRTANQGKPGYTMDVLTMEVL